MSALTLIITLLLIGIAGYGLYAGVMLFFLAGTIGCLAVIFNLTTGDRAIKLLSYWTILGALIYSVYVATQNFF